MARLPNITSLLTQPYNAARWLAASGDHFHVRIGNAPATTDRSASLRSIQTLMEQIEEFGTNYCACITTGSMIFAETDIRFTNRNGRRESIPCAIIARFVDEVLIDLRIHLDPSPIPGYAITKNGHSN